MNSVDPKISIICVCFNHAPYVKASLQSVLHQTYKNYELIVVDDGSTDDSARVINQFIEQHPTVTFIELKHNKGVCHAFNEAYRLSTGAFVIDLAGDDILLPNRLEAGVAAFQMLSPKYGVIFSDAEWVDEHEQHLYFHSQRHPHTTIPQGDVYKDLVERYFICSPTMMFRRSVLETLGGYDEQLTYEDFDFWIRSSRLFHYYYEPKVLVKKRKLKSSLSHSQYKILNKHAASTFRVCEKIMALNQSNAERDILSNRIQYEIRQSLRTLNLNVAYQYMMLWIKNKSRHYD